MNTRYFCPLVALGMLLCGCCQHDKTTSAHPAVTKPNANRYELAGRTSDPLANNGDGTSGGIPSNPAVGRYPGPLTPPVTPLMAFGD